jgi:hypothetical protein
MAPTVLTLVQPRLDVAQWTKQLNRSEPGAISLSMTSPYARLSGGREQESVMLTTLLVIVACFAAGTIVHHLEHARRRW